MYVPKSDSNVLSNVIVVPLIEMKEAEYVPASVKVLAPHMLATPAAVLAASGQ